MAQLLAPQVSSTAWKSTSRVPVVAVGFGDGRDACRDGSRSCTRADLKAKVETRAFLLLLDRVGAFK